MPTRAGRKRGGGDAAATGRLQEQVREGQRYEALQTARALFARLEGQGKGGQARSMALDVARTFAEAGEWKSVLDLARLYMANNSTVPAPLPSESPEEKRVTELSPAEAARAKARAKKAAQDAAAAAAKAAEEEDPAMAEHRFAGGGREQILALATLLPTGSPERLAMLKGVARWAAEEARRPLPDLDVLLELAAAYREAGEHGAAAQRYGQAVALLDAAKDPAGLTAVADAYAKTLAEWASKGYRTEADMFVARAVLQVLSGVPSTEAGTVATAVAYGKAILSAAQASPALAPALEASPLAHFVAILLEVVEHRKPGAPELFKLLSERYQPSIDRDPEFGRAVAGIGEAVFGLRPPPNPMQALLQSMLGGGLGGGGLLGNMLGGGAGGGGGLLGSLGGLGI